MQPEGYATLNYEVQCYSNNKFTTLNPNMISRLRNLMTRAINEQILLPKFIVVVPDDDIIKYLNYSKFGMSEALGRLLNHIMVDYNHLLESQIEFLPRRSCPNALPYIFWIQAPLHTNFSNNLARIKFNKSLETITQFHENIQALELKKGWEPENGNFYLLESRRFTADGLGAYWAAVDKTIRYADMIFIKKLQH